jgi:GMP synthase (glutamine-hydrolysing)
MRILSLVHGPLVRSELFGDVARAAGHDVDEWFVADDPAPPRPIDEYDAVFIFGGDMNVDQENEYPWLHDEDELIRGLAARGVPTLGVCLGAQLVAKAAGAHVGPWAREGGFVPLTLSDDAADDPIFGRLPRSFDVFAVHGYAFEVPEGAVELARSSECAHAFRLGDNVWALQFHPEVRLEQVEAWLREDVAGFDAEKIVDELRRRLAEWQAFGAELCRAFLAAAERAGTGRSAAGAAASR